jgi:hypothetical protein
MIRIHKYVVPGSANCNPPPHFEGVWIVLYEGGRGSRPPGFVVVPDGTDLKGSRLAVALNERILGGFLPLVIERLKASSKPIGETLVRLLQIHPVTLCPIVTESEAVKMQRVKWAARWVAQRDRKECKKNTL